MNRTRFVEFTQPYTDSGLSMVVPTKAEKSAWIFIKPFTGGTWTVTGAILIYTMSIVWFLEHRRNPEFNGPWNIQIGTALWFTFSSLFFAHSKYLSLFLPLARITATVDDASFIMKVDQGKHISEFI